LNTRLPAVAGYLAKYIIADNFCCSQGILVRRWAVAAVVSLMQNTQQLSLYLNENYI